MSQATIHYFSGTGNSYHAARVVEKRLLEAGYSVLWQQVRRDTRPPKTNSDLHIFAFPVYACDVPDIMARYLWKMPPGKGLRAGIIATNGSLHATTRIPGIQGDPGWSFDHAALILRLKGYDVVLADAAPYPAGITQVIPAPGELQCSKILDLADQRVDMLAKKLVAGERSVRHNVLLLLLYVPFGLAYGLFGRHVLGKLYVAGENCNGCGNCVKNCPAGAIRLTSGRPGWDWRCQGCQRCINLCPRKAINTSITRAAIIAVVFFLPTAWLLSALASAGFLLPAGIPGTLLAWALDLAAFLTMLYVADKAVFLLERIPVVRQVLAVNFNWWFRRYVDPAFRQELAKRSRTGKNGGDN